MQHSDCEDNFGISTGFLIPGTQVNGYERNHWCKQSRKSRR